MAIKTFRSVLRRLTGLVNAVRAGMRFRTASAPQPVEKSSEFIGARYPMANPFINDVKLSPAPVVIDEREIRGGQVPPLLR